MTQHISQPPQPSLEGLDTVAFGPDSLQNPHIAVVFTEQEWEEFQGPIMDAWYRRIHGDGNSPPLDRELTDAAVAAGLGQPYGG